MGDEPKADHWLRKLLYDAVFDATTAFLKKHPSLLTEQAERGKTFPWKSCSIRLQNSFDSQSLGYDPQMDKPQTYGEMIEFRLSRVLELRGVGIAFVGEIGDLMDRHGLRNEWEATRL